jgi:hypothetical protein
VRNRVPPASAGIGIEKYGRGCEASRTHCGRGEDENVDKTRGGVKIQVIENSFFTLERTFLGTLIWKYGGKIPPILVAILFLLCVR